MIRLACVFMILTGCGLYSHGDDVCNAAFEAVPSQELRNPVTGICQAFGNGGCDSACGPCAVAAIAPPDWAVCGGSCDSLTEGTCLATARCHAAYRDTDAQSPQFMGCWELPPSGVIEGSCTGLDPQSCSEHDDCISLYSTPQTQGGITTFEACQPEPSATCEGVTCGSADICALQSTAPNTFHATCVTRAVAGSCTAQAACDTVEQPCPAGSTRGVANGCYTPYCIPNAECPQAACSTLTTELACKARSDCDTVYQGSNCTCDHSGCTCQTETFLRCQQ